MPNSLIIFLLDFFAYIYIYIYNNGYFKIIFSFLYLFSNNII